MKERSITVLTEDSVGRKSGIVPFTLTVSPPVPTSSLRSCNVVFPTSTRTRASISRKPFPVAVTE